MLYLLLINVEMPTMVGILILISRINFMLSWAEHEKCFISSRPGYAATTDHRSQTDLQSCQPRVTVASCFVYKIIRNLELIDHLCINPIHTTSIITFR